MFFSSYTDEVNYFCFFLEPSLLLNVVNEHFSQYSKILKTDGVREEIDPLNSNINQLLNSNKISAVLVTFEEYVAAQKCVTSRFHTIQCTSPQLKIEFSCCYAFENPILLQQNQSNNQTNSQNNNNDNNNNTIKLQIKAFIQFIRHFFKFTVFFFVFCFEVFFFCIYLQQQQQQQSQNDITNKFSGLSEQDLNDLNAPLEKRRLFVSSLAYSTTDDTLMNVYSQYGALEDCVIIREKMTGRSRGYGFVVFKTIKGAQNALQMPEKIIDGRRTRAWLASEGNQGQNKKQQFTQRYAGLV